MLDYTATIKETGEGFDTTSEEKAKEHEIFDVDVKYGPRLITIGGYEYPAPAGLDKHLAELSVGQEITVEVPPEEGFGVREQSKIRMISMRKFGEDSERVSVGDVVTVDNKKGTIRFIGSGRVKIDYNHRFAGRTIVYNVRVADLLESTTAKIHAIIDNTFVASDEDEEVAVEISANEVTVTIPPTIFMDDTLAHTKDIAQISILKYVPEIQRVTFVETFSRQPLEKEGAETAEPIPSESEGGMQEGAETAEPIPSESEGGMQEGAETAEPTAQN